VAGSEGKRKKARGSQRKRIEAAGRKPFDEDLEEQLLEWIHEEDQKSSVSRKLMMAKAKSMCEEKSANSDERKDFNASHGWLEVRSL